MTETPHDENVDRTGQRGDRILGTSALRAMAHPLRVQMYDILSQYGPQTASSLAEATGESSGSTSYHLRALAKHNLIREVADRGTGRERWWERSDQSVTFGDASTLTTPAGAAATQAVIREQINARHQQLVDFLQQSLRQGDHPDEWVQATEITTSSARLTLEQMSELTGKLRAVIDETVSKYRHQEGEGIRPITIRTEVFPLRDLVEKS